MTRWRGRWIRRPGSPEHPAGVPAPESRSSPERRLYHCSLSSPLPTLSHQPIFALRVGVVASRHNLYLRFLWVLITTKIFIWVVVPWSGFIFVKDHLWDEPFFEREFWGLNFCTHYYIKVRYVELRMSKHHYITMYKNHTDCTTIWMAKRINFCGKVVLGFDCDDCHWIALAGPCLSNNMMTWDHWRNSGLPKWQNQFCKMENWGDDHE